MSKLILQKASSLLRRVINHSLGLALRSSADSSVLASCVVLLTGCGAYPLRTDGLLSCVLPSEGHTGPLEGNYLLETSPWGDWVMELPKHKTSLSHGPLRMVYPGASREARVLRKWRALLYSPPHQPQPPSAPGLHVLSPLLLRPNNLQPISADNWAGTWKSSLSSMAFLLAEKGTLSDSDLYLATTGALLPSTQQHIRHMYASLKEVMLLEEVGPSPASLDERREALARPMGSSLRQWKRTYSTGFKFWEQVEGFEALSDAHKRAHVEGVKRVCMGGA